MANPYVYINNNTQAYSIFDSPPKPKKTTIFCWFLHCFSIYSPPQNRDQTSPVGWG